MPATVAACGVQQRAWARRRWEAAGDSLGDLLRRCAEKDRDAWNEFVRRFKDDVYSLAFRFLGDKRDAEDVTIEAFLRLWQTPWWSAKPRVIRAWLATVIHNLSADLRRHGGQHCDQPLSSVRLYEADCEQAVLSAEAVRFALERLSCHQRRAVILCMIHGLSSHDAALIMDRSAGTIRRWLSEARVALRESLEMLREAGG